MKKRFILVVLLTFFSNASIAGERVFSIKDLRAQNAYQSDQLQKLETLEKFVRTHSPSSDAVGLGQMRKLVQESFARVGFCFDEMSLRNHHRVMVGRACGIKKSISPRISFIGHLDTVFPEKAPFDQIGFSYSEKKEIIFRGPGSIDMKSGLLTMLGILEGLSPESRLTIQILLNDDEELGSPYSRKTFSKLSQNTFALIFEPGLPNGDYVQSSSGGKWIEIRAQGKAAHAGAFHRLGRNACAALSQLGSDLQKETNYQKGLTVNLGVIKGGGVANQVCDFARAVFDVRYPSRKVFRSFFPKVMEKIRHLENETGVIFQVLEQVDVPPFEEKSSFFLKVQLEKQIRRFSSIEKKIKGVHVGYAHDGNHLSAAGVLALAGLGPYGGGMHTSDEYLIVSSLFERIRLGVHFVEAILRSS